MQPGRIFPALCICWVLFLACRNSHPAGHRQSIPSAILHCEEEFHIEGLTYLVAENGHIISAYPRGGAEEMRYDQATLSHFITPLILDRMIRDSVVHERDSVTRWLKAKDLIFVPADYYERDQGLKDPMTERISKLIENYRRRGVAYDTTWLAGKLQFHTTHDMQDLLRDLWQVSAYFDQTYPEYSFSDKHIYNVFPTWYTKGLSGFFGWRILKFQGQTVLWNCFVTGHSTLLVIKFVEKGVFTALSYTTGSLPSPMDQNRSDLLLSPLALSVFKALYLQEPSIDYRQPADSLYTMLNKTESSSYNFIYLHDLQAHARLYDQTGVKVQAKVLYTVQERLIKDSLLVRYENKPVQAEISYVSDNLKATVPFTLQKPAFVQLFAGGQLRPAHDYSGESYQFDNIQLFINDHAGEKNNSWLNTHLFQFNYGSDTARGTEAICATGDPSDTSYIIEARIDWKILNPAKHAIGRRILANVLIGDCDLDEGQRKSVLSWTIGAKDAFGDEKKYGRIILAGRSGKTGDKIQYAIRSTGPPQIDGKAEDLWSKAPWSVIALPYIGSVSRPDNAGRFKAMYDDDYLYLLFEVTDNIKNRYGFVTADKCWIEDAVSGLPVWKMGGDTTDAYPEFSYRRRIFLPAGNYLLKYVSDKGNSYEHWYGKPPANGLYGASVYLAEE